MTREEIIELIKDVLDSENKTEVEITNLLILLKKNVPHPAPSNLIYHDNLTPEEIADRALGYKPIILQGSYGILISH